MRVVVAMSGGVDSSVAASLLVEADHDVVGLSMQLYDQREGRDSFGSCCSLDDLQDARRVAATLGFPHYILNLEDEFRDTVVRNFVSEYASGRTPIPCVHCNADLKFSTLVERANGLGAAAVATGHYARAEFDEDARRYRLLRAVDRDKDQTYFLFSLTQDQLSRAMFPVGHLTKPQVREHASRVGLAVADKPDSHEICFVQNETAGDFVQRKMDSPPDTGDIVDTTGRVLGQHRGLHRYTVGQRKGLGISGAVPLYVVQLETADRRLVVGPREELGRTSLSASSVNWISGTVPAEPTRASVRIRHRHADAPATVVSDGRNRAAVTFDGPQMAVTPGQAVVFYDGDEVLGGGWID